jgi:hypothetical protein
LREARLDLKGVGGDNGVNRAVHGRMTFTIRVKTQNTRTRRWAECQSPDGGVDEVGR